jgi:hypothetical protein
MKMLPCHSKKTYLSIRMQHHLFLEEKMECYVM